MTRFSAEWLSLREPFDLAARAAPATAMLDEQLQRWRAASTTPTLEVLDLACGQGANLRALAPRLGGVQRWQLLDHDAELLAAVPQVLAAWAGQQRYRFARSDGREGETLMQLGGAGFQATISCHRIDLARDLAALAVPQRSLVTASALLDLVSAPWLQALVQRSRAAEAAMCFALSVDGRTHWDPADPLDDTVHQLFSRHQRRDKGFGPALGPQATTMALQQMAQAGYHAMQAATDWVIAGARAARMQRAMIEGIAAAAQEQDPDAQAVVQPWAQRRRARVDTSRLQVGHLDIVATLR